MNAGQQTSCTTMQTSIMQTSFADRIEQARAELVAARQLFREIREHLARVVEILPENETPDCDLVCEGLLPRPVAFEIAAKAGFADEFLDEAEQLLDAAISATPESLDTEWREQQRAEFARKYPRSA